MSNELIELASKLLALNKQHNFIISTAESCTGGLVSSYITEISGSSAYFDRSFITYTNKAKMEMLSVKEESLINFGAVSLNVAKEMALGAILHSDATFSVSLTGIAGPTGGTDNKPVGTVCIGFCSRDGFLGAKKYLFKGDRQEVRESAVKVALSDLIKIIQDKKLEDYL